MPIGDPLVKLSGERVYSALHRVVGMFNQISQSPLHPVKHRRPLWSACKLKLNLPDVPLYITRDLTGISSSRASSIQMMARKRLRQIPGLLYG